MKNSQKPQIAEFQPVKKGHERVWRFAFFVFLLAFIVLLPRCNEFANLAREKGFKEPLFSDLWIALTSTIVIAILRELFYIRMRNWVSRHLKDTYCSELREYQINKCLKWLFDCPYYLLFVIISWALFHKTEALPGGFGGQGSISDIFIYYPQVPPIWGLKEFYLIQLGHHFYSLVSFAFSRWNDPKFYEYTLHHFMAFSLIFYSYMFNFLIFGVMVLFAHDIGDILLSILRAFGELTVLKHRYLFFVGLFTLFSWFYGRILFFPQMVFTATYMIPQNPSIWPDVWPFAVYGYMYTNLMVITLQMMNLYWFYFMVKMLYNAVTKRVTKNIYENIKEDPQVQKRS